MVDITKRTNLLIRRSTHAVACPDDTTGLPVVYMQMPAVPDLKKHIPNEQAHPFLGSSTNSGLPFESRLSWTMLPSHRGDMKAVAVSLCGGKCNGKDWFRTTSCWSWTGKHRCDRGNGRRNPKRTRGISASRTTDLSDERDFTAERFEAPVESITGLSLPYVAEADYSRRSSA